MLTREQWEDLARFAGVPIVWKENLVLKAIAADENDFVPLRTDTDQTWFPLTSWLDFGPMWVLLEKWISTNIVIAHRSPNFLFNPKNNLAIHIFRKAINSGTHQQIMHAGCLLGAAIGATMREEKV